jgi:hypothetical protein
MAHQHSGAQKQEQPGAWKAGLNDFEVVKTLMKRMGSKSGFDPLPPSQIDWMLDEDQPPFIRMFGWMLKHTIHWHHRNEYAVSDDTPQRVRTLEVMAADLAMDEANVRSYWKQGVERGVWRNGAAKGEAARLYLCGHVPKRQAPEGEEKENEMVCTDPFPPYISKQIKKLDPERRAAFLQRHTNRVEARKLRQAALMAADRDWDTQDEDSLFSEFGIKKIREEHAKRRVDPEEAAIRAEVMRTLAPVVERCAQTVSAFVQTRNSARTNGFDEGVHTAATLLPSNELPHENPERAVSVGRTAPGTEAETPFPEGGGMQLNDQYARQAAPPKTSPPKTKPSRPELPPLTGAEAEAEALAFSELRAAQQAFPHTDFSSELISPSNPGDVATVRRILRLVSAEYMASFLDFVRSKFRGLDRNALGLLPARSPAHPHGPRSLGLIVCWAEDYAKRLTPAARDEVRHAAITAPRREEELAFCRAILADPRESAQMQDLAREILRDHAKAAKAGGA